MRIVLVTLWSKAIMKCFYSWSLVSMPLAEYDTADSDLGQQFVSITISFTLLIL